MSLINRRNLLIAGLSAGVVAGIGGVMTAPARQASAKPLTIEDVLFDPENPVLGNPEGAISIVEFFDYQCAYCKVNHPDLMDVVKADGDIRLVMKDWPIFGAPSVRASQLVLGAVDAGHYELANSALMATRGRLSEAEIETALRKAGLDVTALDAAYRAKRKQWDGLITRNDFQAVQIGLQGTPAFIIEQTIYAGAMDRSALLNAIDKARREAL